MPITVQGTLRDPLDQIASHAKLRFTTIHGGGDTLNSAVTVYQANGLGDYDFILVDGIHKLEVKFHEQWFYLGDISVVGELTDVMTIAQLLNLTTPPDDPALAEMRTILAQVNAAASGLDDLVTQAGNHAVTAQNAATESSQFATASEQSSNQSAAFTEDAEEFAIRAEVAAEKAESGAGGGGVNISIAGQSYAIRGQTVSWEITDFDEFSPYEVTVPSGVNGAVSGRFFSIRVDAGFVGDSLNFSLKRDSFNKQFTVRVLDQAITKPSIVFPLNGDFDINLRPVFESSEFTSVPENFIHTQTQWQLSLLPDFSVNQIDTGESSNLTSLNILQYANGGLFGNEDYYLRVRYIGTRQGIPATSEWSDAVTFKTLVAADSVWRKTADYNVNIADESIKHMVKIGEFLGVVRYGEHDTTLFVYDRSGDLIGSNTVNRSIVSRFDPDSRRLTCSVSHPAQYESARMQITTYGAITAGTTTAINYAAFEVSLDSGVIMRSVGRQDGVPADGIVDRNPVWRSTHLYREGITSVTRVMNASITTSSSGFITTSTTSTSNTIDYIAQDFRTVTTNTQSVVWSSGSQLCNLMSASTNTTSFPAARCKFNFITGVVHHTHTSLGLTQTHTARNINPSISNTYDLDNVVLSNPIDFNPHGSEVIESKAIIFNPNPDSKLNTPLLVDFNGVGETETIQAQVVNTANYPDLKDPSVVGYVANAVGRHNDKSISALQVLAKVGNTVQVWELDCSNIM